MNDILSIPLELRLLILFFVGLLVGGQLNRGIYRLAWQQRAIGPWSLPHERAPARRAGDRLPVIGWWLLRRESHIHGRHYWLRPLLIELATGLGFAMLYWYEVDRGWVTDYGPQVAPAVLHAQYLSHIVVICFMLMATFIDFDEQTIPDAVTVPGTLAGLALAAALPASRPLVTVAATSGSTVAPLHVASATARAGLSDWPSWLDGNEGLVLGMLAFLAWWLAILPWTWTTRRGLGKACQYFVASLIRRTGFLMVGLAVLGVAGIAGGWWIGGSVWQSLLSALVGLAFGGGLIWAVRIVGTQALGQEAMGFGDVTLMAMIGTYVGWQATLMIFFLAPVAALFVSVSQWVLTGRKDIAFGPYLCLATLLVLLRWGWLWEHYGRQVFSLGWFVPAMVLGCVAVMWALLTLMSFLRGLFDPT